jgi:hypothetical protein
MLFRLHGLFENRCLHDAPELGRGRCADSPDVPDLWKQVLTSFYISDCRLKAGGIASHHDTAGNERRFAPHRLASMR